MRQAGTLTKNPTLLTAVLSLAAVAGYLTYRLTTGTAELPADPTAAPLTATDHDHAGEHAPLADSLPAIVLDDLTGTPTALESFGGQPLLINFWATWCAPCLREIPLLKSFHETDPSIRVVGIAVDRLEDVLEYAAEMEFNYPILVGQSDGMDAMATFRNDAGAMPFSVFTAPDGAILGTHAGELHAEHLENLSATIDALATGAIDRATARERIAGLQ
jgi:thiol-disulfide isomerase/thioredoxin